MIVSLTIINLLQRLQDKLDMVCSTSCELQSRNVYASRVKHHIYQGWLKSQQVFPFRAWE